MRKLHGLLTSAVLLCLTAGATGCSDKEECQSASSACGAFTACCTSDDCYYLAGGNRFNCNGTDCNSAAEDLANYLCTGLKDRSPEDYRRVVEEILERMDGPMAVRFH